MKRAWKKLTLILLLCALLAACAAPAETAEPAVPEETTLEEPAQEEAAWLSRSLNVPDDKYRTFYEIFVYSFYDSDGDGTGDLNGVLRQLDYLNDGDDSTDTDLGINGIWLMPIMPSTTYHKYDTTDYMDVDPEYGTLEDFQALLDACHGRGIRVILDLAMNHSSSQHPWFQTAVEYLRSLPADADPDPAACPYVDYYHFSREGGSGYSPVSGTDWYYEARFWSEMPDLNLENPAVRAEFEAIAGFWLDLGVDGFRLDAVKEFVSGSVTANVEILSWFNSYVKSVNPDAYLVCECWADQNTYAQYYASGVDSMFDFAFADSDGIIASVLKGTQKATAYGKALEAEQALYASYNPDYISAPFYTNHDLGRTAGYYAGDNSEAQTKMGNAMNLLMSGNVFLYYGEELGMKGAGADENKRVGMYWSANPDAEGMCDGPEGANVTMKFESLAEQSQDPNSIYQYVRQAIRLRNQNPEIARGEAAYHDEFSGDRLCVITKSYEGRELLLVFNTGAEEASVDLTGLTVQGEAVSELSVLGELLTGGTPASVSGSTVTLPPYAILVLGT